MKSETRKDDSWKIINQTTMGGYSFRNIIRLLWIVRFRISPRYIPRLFWVLWISIITSPMRMIEKIRFQKKIKETIIKKDPIFIIGFYRTATTLLHILLAKDPQFGYLSNLDGFIPLMNLSFSKSSSRMLEKRLPEKRPMDNLELRIDAPQEESYAMGAMCKHSIINTLIFPNNYEDFTKYIFPDECSEKERQQWNENYRFILQKISFKHKGKQLVLKNPANASRIPNLLKIYPNAKFIYTYRNPYTLFCSMKVLLQKLIEISTLQSWDTQKFEAQFAQLLEKSFALYNESLSLIPSENLIKVKYEDFVKNPLPFLEKIYAKFTLPNFEEVKPQFESYISQKRNYQPNKHIITPHIISLVNKYWEDYRLSFGYEKLDS